MTQPRVTQSDSVRDHDHVFLGSAHEGNARRTMWVVWLTVAAMIGEITAGYITGSMALLADGFHMATHAGALGIAAAAYAYAMRHARSDRYSFGTGKVGDLGGFASALILGLVALGLGFESVMRLLQPITVQFGAAILVAILGLVVNVVSAVLLGHGHDHDDHGHAHHHHGGDNNLKSAYFHVLADALTSVLAIAGLLAGRYLGWVWMDPVMGIVGALVIARWAWTLIRVTSGVLLDRTDPQVAEEIRKLVEAPGDATIVDLHVWQVGPEALAAIVSVVAHGVPDADEVRRRLEAVHEVRHLTVELRNGVLG
ncbi:cation diffusion facilitator family transporter [Halopseudomonas xinjiangensis]|uniref:Cation diffusion facilitator family transporter n=1 Tax=Halopseudomonas xinjiangensis TaxID=487184 RepID=A0A1H1NLL9_9GAMM|nr:CDF family Co(II)/Ni(II) efflux transporter DmeF [Halopseudomonas xinjiangensis]SDR99807.1 cation diffusion facilitator family transporter [Halopseudomonas xinjiangensis]